MSESTPEVTRPRRRWLKIGLAASVAINLLLVGAIAGHAFYRPSLRFRFYHHSLRARTMWVIHSITGPLPPPAERAIQRAVSDNWPRIKADMGAIRDAKREARASVHRAPFDAKAVTAAFDNVAARIQVIENDLHQILVQTMVKLPPNALDPPRP